VSARRLYGAVAVCAAVVYAGALWNQFALDDNQLVPRATRCSRVKPQRPPSCQSIGVSSERSVRYSPPDRRRPWALTSARLTR